MQAKLKKAITMAVEEAKSALVPFTDLKEFIQWEQ